MSLPPKHEVTELLLAWGQGDEHALERLVPAVHAELHRLAHKYMHRQRPGHTLQTTALINEAYFRLVKTNQVQWRDRTHFFAVAATIMRRILIDFARSRLHQKRGGRKCQLSLDQVADFAVVTPPDVVALNDALNALAQVDERKAKVVELRFFGGLTAEETAEVLGVSSDTVTRDWGFARVWLLRELRKQERSGPGAI